MREITADIHARLTRAGFAHVTVNTQLAPPWTTDWITERGPPQARRQRHRPANPGPPPVRPHPADADRPAAGPLSPLRLRRHPSHGRVQRHRLQVPAPLQRLRRALRGGQGAMTVSTDQSPARPAVAHRLPPARRRQHRPAHRRLGRDHVQGPGRPGRRLRLPARPVADRPPRRGAPLVLHLRPGRRRPPHRGPRGRRRRRLRLARPHRSGPATPSTSRSPAAPSPPTCRSPAATC